MNGNWIHLLIAMFAAMVVIACAAFGLKRWGGVLGQDGNMGNFLGIVSLLFSLTSFAFAVYTARIDGHGLHLQRRQYDRDAIENKRTAALQAQIEAIKLTYPEASVGIAGQAAEMRALARRLSGEADELEREFRKKY